MTRIFDNIAEPLGKHLQATLPAFSRMDVAVGYFNLRGWQLFDRIVEQHDTKGSPVVRILIGMVMGGPQQEALDELDSEVSGSDTTDADRAIANERKALLLEQLRTQLMRGLPTASDRKTLRSLRQLIAEERVEIRVFTRRPLHGKTYIFHRQDLNSPRVGFVGSSNLTSPGLTSNLELNVDVTEFGAASALADWFEARWDDRFSRPVSKEMLDLLDESWATPINRPPYDVFLKVCYDLSRDVREGVAEYSIPAEVDSKLLDYQKTAVRTLARRIVTRRGTMLGDVVGLGKTLTAIAVALMLRDEHGYNPLIICPKNLVSMWEQHLDAYDLHGTVVSYTQTHNVLPDLRRYAFVIVDESHTLRNSERRDYRALQAYVRENESRVLLLTATPYNIKFGDVANQLGVYLDDDDDLGLTPAVALAANPRLSDRLAGKTSTLEAFKHSEEPDDWKRLMSEHLVRRTRSFIKSNFSQIDEDGNEFLEFSDGSRFKFPERRAVPISHSFGEQDPAHVMSSDETLNQIRDLVLPRYQLGRYLKSTLPNDLSDTELQYVSDLRRGRGQVAGFVRTMFYKRLSSCGHSFVLSLERHLTRNELFLHAIESNLPLPAGTIAEGDLADDQDPSDYEATEDQIDSIAEKYERLAEAASGSVRWVRADLFLERLREDLVRDSNHLRTLLAAFGDWEPARDSKLSELARLVKSTHPDDKLLVFTEYRDTAVYIFKTLTDLGISDIALATGQTENPTEIAHRFSPSSNGLPGEEITDTGPEYRVLVATDVLSEGQNLQDCHIVVNYDLPWAIIRLIQRAGRVDRIGQLAETVKIYSFFHESVEAVISLRSRIADRLSANAEAFGSDEQFFGSDDEVQTLTDLYDGKLDDLDSSDDVDASSLAFQYWEAARKLDATRAARIASLPDLIDATRARRPTDTEDGVLCYVRTHSGVDGFGMCSPGADPRLLTSHEALKTFEASPTEPGLEIREDHEESVASLVRGVLAIPEGVSGRLRGIRRIIWRRLGEKLRPPNVEVDNALDALYQHPLTRDAERRLRRSMRSGIDDDTLATRLAALHRDDHLVIESRGATDPIRIVSSMGIR